MPSGFLFYDQFSQQYVDCGVNRESLCESLLFYRKHLLKSTHHSTGLSALQAFFVLLHCIKNKILIAVVFHAC